MKIEKIHEGFRYTLSNEGLNTNDKVFPVANGRCIDKDGWILHGFDFGEYCSGFPNRPHTIIDLKYSNYKPEQIRTTHGFGPIEMYYKIVKLEKKIDSNPDSIFKTFKWVEIELHEIYTVS